MSIGFERCPVHDRPLIWTWDGRLVCPVLGCDGDAAPAELLNVAEVPWRKHDRDVPATDLVKHRLVISQVVTHPRLESLGHAVKHILVREAGDGLRRFRELDVEVPVLLYPHAPSKPVWPSDQLDVFDGKFVSHYATVLARPRLTKPSPGQAGEGRPARAVQGRGLHTGREVGHAQGPSTALAGGGDGPELHRAGVTTTSPQTPHDPAVRFPPPNRKRRESTPGGGVHHGALSTRAPQPLAAKETAGPGGHRTSRSEIERAHLPSLRRAHRFLGGVR